MEAIMVFYLGVDFVRGTLFDHNGEERLTIEKTLNLFVDEEYVEQNPLQWVDSIASIICEFRQQCEEVIIDTMAVTYQPGTCVFVDKWGNHIMNAIMPCDRRARYQAHTCEKSVGKHGAFTGVSWQYMALPKLLWVKYNKPDVYRRIFKVLTPDAYIAYKLCGESAIDCYSAILFGYNLKDSDYNSRTLKALDMDIQMLPKVRKVGERIGVIGGEVKKDLNLKHDVNFVLVSNSIMLPSLSGIKEENKVIYDVVSSNISIINQYSKIKKVSESLRIPLKDDKFLYATLLSDDIQFLKWVNYYGKDCEGSKEYDPGSKGIIVLPFMMGDGFNSNSDMRGCILGITPNCGTHDIITACYESLGYTLKSRIDYMCERGMKVDAIEVIDDDDNELFTRIICDITGKEVRKRANLCIMKCIYYAAVLGAIDEDDKIIRALPNEEMSYKYKQLYNLYKSAYASLEDIHRYRRKIVRKII